MVSCMTLREYRVNLGWSQHELAKEAGISPSIVKRAEDGLPIQARTARALADALSKAYGRDIRPIDIAGLNIL
jgi:transcriptional regulator with XRE-family HTH domain